MPKSIAVFDITIVDGPRLTVVYDPKGPDASPASAGPVTLDLAGVRYRTIDLLISLLRDNRLGREAEYEVLGENLFSLLFLTPDGRQFNECGILLQRAVREARRNSWLLRIALQFSELQPFLAAWPWEYLRWPTRPGETEGEFFLAHEAKLTLTRFLALTDEPLGGPGQPPLKVLLVAPSPKKIRASDDNLTWVEAGSVLRELQDLSTDRAKSDNAMKVRVAYLPSADAIENAPKARVATFKEFVSALDSFDPHVVHFIGHGRHTSLDEGAIGELAFTRQDGGPAWIADKDVANVLANRARLRLVFLQACQSAESKGAAPYQVVAGLAQRLSQKNIPAVVAMHFNVEGRIANSLARTFYSSLADLNSVEIAINTTRQNLAEPGGQDAGLWASFGLPVLYLRGQGQVLAEVNTNETSTTSKSSVQHCPYDDFLWDPKMGDVFCDKCHRRLICQACEWVRWKPVETCSRCERPFSDPEPAGSEVPGVDSLAGRAGSSSFELGR